ncbi:hypothetical protein FOCC_FOCC016578, partial [Frankliniella occidentalis]
MAAGHAAWLRRAGLGAVRPGLALPTAKEPAPGFHVLSEEQRCRRRWQRRRRRGRRGLGRRPGPGRRARPPSRRLAGRLRAQGQERRAAGAAEEPGGEVGAQALHPVRPEAPQAAVDGGHREEGHVGRQYEEQRVVGVLGVHRVGAVSLHLRVAAHGLERVLRHRGE